MKKYILMGGHIPKFGEYQYVSAHQLQRLYNLNPRECILVDQHNGRDKQKLKGLDMSKFKVLCPRPDGKYEAITKE